MKKYQLQFKEKKWQCDYAATFFERGWGLLGRKSYPSNRVMVIPKCGSVHTWFMRFNIDVVFLDRDGKVLCIKNNVKPWKMLWGGSKAVTALETISCNPKESGVFSNINVGDILRVYKD